VARREREREQRAAQRARRGLELLRELDLFLALERAGAADLLEIGFERPALARGLEILGGQGSGLATAGLPAGLVTGGHLERLVELHQATSRALERRSSECVSRSHALMPPAGEQLHPEPDRRTAWGARRPTTNGPLPGFFLPGGAAGGAYLLAPARK
jgi:hypothetical protein